jgi:SAM-dependent methyltransferase/DNA-binding transcriptional ArsR family regulator
LRIGPIAENLLERVAILLRLGPRPLLETHGTLLLAQAIMVATKVGVFEALAASPLTAGELASRCGTDERATVKLLGVLEATGYVRAAAEGRYALTSDARRWLLESSALSLHDNVLFRFVEWEWIGRLEHFVVTGEPLDIHAEMSQEQWSLYQRGMRSLAGSLAREVVLRTPVPRGARAMLDVGGSHGFFSVALCRRHPALRAEILDLPGALAHAAPILDHEGLGDRVTHRGGDALTDDLGRGAFDLVFVSNLLHHFEPAQCRNVIRRAADALRPGGILVIQELFALSSTRRAGQAATLADLYFALTSRSGALSVEDLAAWQAEAGLTPRKPIRFVSFPGAVQQSAVKPR